MKLLPSCSHHSSRRRRHHVTALPPCFGRLHLMFPPLSPRRRHRKDRIHCQHQLGVAFLLG
jgi:hypothetical protein